MIKLSLRNLPKSLFGTSALVLASACTTGTTTTTSGGCVAPTPSTTARNVMSVSVNGSKCSAGSYFNKPCVSVTICKQNTTTCATVSDILLDSGSSGLRIYGSAIHAANSSMFPPGDLSSAMPAPGHSSSSLLACARFGDGSALWGSMVTADVSFGNESKVTIPIEVVDSTVGTTTPKIPCGGTAYLDTSACSTGGSCPASSQGWPDQSPDDSGLNGIMGVGLLKSDCGTNCGAEQNDFFYCASNSCTSVGVPDSSQPLNPVAALPAGENNGITFDLPAAGLGGVPSLTGYVTFGIPTDSSKLVCPLKAYPASETDVSFIVSFNKKVGTGSFVDSGSNTYEFNQTGLANVPDCGTIGGADYTGYDCPTSTQALTGTAEGYQGDPSAIFSFNVGNAYHLYSSGNNVFQEFATNYVGESPIPNDFDLGLPFFLGREVSIGLDGTTSAFGTGPYWAF